VRSFCPQFGILRWTISACGLFLCGGCALPRAVVMDSLVRREAPVPEGGERRSVHVNPWFSESSAETVIATSMSTSDAAEWYRKRFETRGWEYRPEYKSTRGDGTVSSRYTKRVDWGGDTGDLAIQEITLDLWISAAKNCQGSLIEADIYCQVNGWWNPLTFVLFVPFYYTFGEEEFYRPLFALF
jgi:hypothetical protein